MPIAPSPSAIVLLSGILDQHCETHGIKSVEGRESVAASLIRHFGEGVRAREQLLVLLEREDRPERPVRDSRETPAANPGGHRGKI